jgi:membrane-associated phospholipid phosphatase
MDFQAFWWLVTTVGDPTFLSAAVIALLALFAAMRKGYVRYEGVKRHQAALKGFLLIAVPVLAISIVGAEALKLLFQIPRPCVPCPGAGCSIFCPPTFSFPSSHASGSIAVAAAVFLVGGMRKRYLAVFAFPALVCASRIALGVHTVFDVTAGLVLGLAVTAIVWKHRKKVFRWEERML